MKFVGSGFQCLIEIDNGKSRHLQYWCKEFDILFSSIAPSNLGQFSKPEADLKSTGPDVFKTPPTCTIWPSFGRDIWG